MNAPKPMLEWKRDEHGDLRVELWGSDVHLSTLLVQSLDSPASQLRCENMHDASARYIWWCSDCNEGTAEGNEVAHEIDGMVAAERCAKAVLRDALSKLTGAH